MKHSIFPLLGAAALALALSACGGGDASSSSMPTLAEGSNMAVNGSDVSNSTLADNQEPERHMMTVDETIDYFMSLDPKQLGLVEESMDKYTVYPSEKAIPVDNMPCMKVIAYKDTEVHSNQPEATFLVARDGTAVYLLKDDDTVEKLF